MLKNKPALGKLFFSSVPSSNSLGLGINLDKYFASGWNYIEKKDTLRFGILGGRRTLSKTSDTNLDCAILKKPQIIITKRVKDRRKVKVSNYFWHDSY